MKTLIIALFLVIQAQAFAKSKVITTKEYSDVFKSIEQMGEKYGRSNVLVVFDIDDTLLVTPDCQRPDGTWARGNTKLFVCPTHHTEKDLSLKIKEIQEEGFSTIALTARGNVLVESTQRELARLHENALEINFDAQPFDQVIESILVPKTKSCKKGETPPCLSGKFSDRPQFRKGVMYANATNKGLALKALLESLGQSYPAIIFVDDNRKNSEHIHSVYKNEKSVDMEIFLYLRYRD